ncbi:MAG: DISARM system phospholipase D-like protein DrmC [Actinomycetes bacterium]
MSAEDGSAARRLGALLTGTEAKEVADRLDDGDTLTAALRALSAARRIEARRLLVAAGLADVATRRQAVAVLRGIEGARSAATSLDPWWTMPGHLARGGPLTGSVKHLVDGARFSVICSTFNFQRTSQLWHALRRAAERPEVAVRVYLDTRAADSGPLSGSPTTTEVAQHLYPGVVLRTRRVAGGDGFAISSELDGTYVRNHAKFLAVDHRFLLITSANFSWSAEHGNVELGVLIDDVALTESVEREMAQAEQSAFERVSGT